MLYEIFITMVAFLFFGLWLYTRNDNKALYEKYYKLEADSRASEEGVQEIVDNYENDLLQASETLDKTIIQKNLLYVQIEERDDIIEHHAKKCHGIVEDSFELIKFRFRQHHPEALDQFHEHSFDVSCRKADCKVNQHSHGNHVYFDEVVTMRLE